MVRSQRSVNNCVGPQDAHSDHFKHLLLSSCIIGFCISATIIPLPSHHLEPADSVMHSLRVARSRP
ncbi:hypothetical protein BDY19DRAFT_997005 [Irpex rosettiformis]|uniref:Uncharacterized protein n=1 Tax=Irpex rosettiformis TaxID=378272 RepID=A0ACB8TSU8_9APHY|nr:hypothetical protein BDY19DRAFT_997005 [Irpex rosettiformis]